jgi:putative Mn2+ efflux pump MntP
MSVGLLKIFVVALALALDVFAVSIGVGMRGIRNRRKIQVGLAFATAEVSMTLLGALIGAVLGRLIGGVAGYLGFIALFGVGVYMMRESRTELSETSRLDLSRGHGLLLASFAISLDSLGIGFSILYIGVPMPLSLFIIAITNIASTTLGLTLGKWLGRYAERNAAFFGGLLLALTGVVFGIFKALHVG